jgi:hypothetical protein
MIFDEEGQDVGVLLQPGLELRVADSGFSEGTVEQEHCLFEFGRQYRQLVALCVHTQRLEQQLAGGFHIGGGRLAQVIVARQLAQRYFKVDELVTRAHEQRMRHLARADAEGVAAIFAQLGHQRAKVAVAGEDDKGVDLGALDRHLQRIERHADVGAILAGADAENLNQIDGIIHQVFAIARKAAPVAVGAHDRNRATIFEIFDQRGEFEVEEFLFGPKRNILKIHKDSQLVTH